MSIQCINIDINICVMYVRIENLVFCDESEDGNLKVTDFGFATLLRENNKYSLESGVLLGTVI